MQASQIWGGLRYDDLQKIKPGELHLTNGRLTTLLRVTKTSGPGRECKSCQFVFLNKLSFGVRMDSNWF